MSNLHFFYSCSDELKTGKLLSDRYDFLQKHMNVFVFKPKSDEKPESKIVSKSGLECSAKILSRLNFDNIVRQTGFFRSAVLVDDIHMFTPKDVDVLVKIADEYNNMILCYGFLTDTNEEMYPSSKHLIEVGAKLHDLPCVCQNGSCRNGADHRLAYNKLGKVVSGSGTFYKALCRKCYDHETWKQR